jgi:hypothetical protein
VQEVVGAHWARGWVLTVVLVNDGGGTNDGGDDTPPTPPASQATAHGVGHG